MVVTLDLSVLIDAIRSPEHAEQLAAFALSGHRIGISSVVVAELELGARTPRARASLRTGMLGRLLASNGHLAPAPEDWFEMGRLLAEHPEWAHTASRQNDILLAQQCARLGWALVTRDADFVALRPLCPGLAILPPFPA